MGLPVATLAGRVLVPYADDVVTAAAALVAMLACLRAAGRANSGRAFWYLLGGACAAWSAGEVTWGVYELGLREPVPALSWADAGYLAALPLAAAALLVHPVVRDEPRLRIRAFLDALIVATSILFLAWTIELGPLWHSTDLGAAAGIAAFAYPTGDVVVVVLVVLALRHLPRPTPVYLRLLLCGLLMIAVSDATYAYLREISGYHTGNVIDLGWVGGYASIAAGGLAFRQDDVERVARPLSLAAVVAPFLAALGALGTIAADIDLGHHLDRFAWCTALVLCALVLARQFFLGCDLGRHRGSRVTSLTSPEAR